MVTVMDHGRLPSAPALSPLRAEPASRLGASRFDHLSREVRMNILGVKIIGYVTILLAAVYDVITPNDQNSTAVLLGIAGLLLLVLAELRAIAAHLRAER
jgi:predicted cobalt transporter CbtA